jgi:hypothetical protein
MAQWPCFAATVGGNIAYIGNGAAMDILDISQPTWPIKIGQVITPSVVQDIQIVDHFAYIANGKAGLRIIDIAHPNSPQEVGFYQTGDYARDVYVVNNLIYVADGNDGFYILQNDLASSVEEYHGHRPISLYTESSQPLQPFYHHSLRHRQAGPCDVESVQSARTRNRHAGE